MFAATRNGAALPWKNSGTGGRPTLNRRAAHGAPASSGPGQDMNPGSRPEPRFMTGLLPVLFEWRRGLGAVASLVVLAVAGIAGEWIVHQTQYFIEYGTRFQYVMATTPHHLYMGWAGLVLAVLALLLVTCASLAISLRARETRRLLAVLPDRVQHFVPVDLPRVRPTSVLATAIFLSLYQSCVYLLQENLESNAMGAGWPGMSVLFGAGHITVVPLHFLVALCLSVLLWSLARCLRYSRRSVSVARLLARLYAPVDPRAGNRRALVEDVPPHDRVATARSLRSPPIAV